MYGDIYIYICFILRRFPIFTQKGCCPLGIKGACHRSLSPGAAPCCCVVSPAALSSGPAIPSGPPATLHACRACAASSGLSKVAR